MDEMPGPVFHERTSMDDVAGWWEGEKTRCKWKAERDAEDSAVKELL